MDVEIREVKELRRLQTAKCCGCCCRKGTCLSAIMVIGLAMQLGFAFVLFPVQIASIVMSSTSQNGYNSAEAFKGDFVWAQINRLLVQFPLILLIYVQGYYGLRWLRNGRQRRDFSPYYNTFLTYNLYAIVCAFQVILASSVAYQNIEDYRSYFRERFDEASERLANQQRLEVICLMALYASVFIMSALNLYAKHTYNKLLQKKTLLRQTALKKIDRLLRQQMSALTPSQVVYLRSVAECLCSKGYTYERKRASIKAAKAINVDSLQMQHSSEQPLQLTVDESLLLNASPAPQH